MSGARMIESGTGGTAEVGDVGWSIGLGIGRGGESDSDEQGEGRGVTVEMGRGTDGPDLALG